VNITNLDQIKQLRRDDDPAGRAERVRRYNEMMQPVFDKQLWDGRAERVYRYLKSPQTFQGPLDGRAWPGGDAWFKPEEWKIVVGKDGKERAVRTVKPVEVVERETLRSSA
jgi:hypothetical protein